MLSCDHCWVSARCAYDACITDDDCPNGGVCECGAGDGQQNICAPGDCRTDADCGERGVCALERYQEAGKRRRDGYGSYHCLTIFDECRSDADCGGYLCGHIVFKGASRWVCHGGLQCA